MDQIRLRVTGTHALLMHADVLANPLSPITKAHKALTGVRKKTDDDHAAIAKSEFIAGAYWDEAAGFFVPGQNFDASFLAGAKLSKLGTQWKRGAMVLEDRVKLLHDGPGTPEALWDSPRHVDCRGVKVGTAKIMRYRPVFYPWSAELTIAVDTSVLNIDEARKAVSDAGALIGVCEYRPRFGRFEVTYE